MITFDKPLFCSISM